MTVLYTPGTSSPYTAKLWSARLYQDSIFGTPILADAMSDGIILKKDDLVRSAGDRVQISFSERLTGAGIRGDLPKRPSTVQQEYQYHNLNIDKLSSNPVSAKMDGTISQQRTAFDLEEPLYTSVADWFQQRLIAGFFNQLGGNTATSISFDGTTYTGDSLTNITGLNSATAPSTNRVVYATGSSDANVAASSSATIGLDAVYELEAKAESQIAGVQNFIPIIGKPYKYKLYVARTGYRQLWEEAQASGSVTLSQIVLNRMAGGEKDASAMIGDSFQHSQTQIIAVPDHYIPRGVTASAAQANTRRAIFVGASACCLAFGKGYDATAKDAAMPGFKILTDTDKIEETVITSATGCFGMSKTKVGDDDLSVITYSHYVAN